jgi:hypothetical protein
MPLIGRMTEGGVVRALLGPLRTLLVFLLLVLFANPCLALATEESDLTARVAIHLVGDGTPGPYQLGDRFILEGTEEVIKGKSPSRLQFIPLILCRLTMKSSTLT